MRCPMRRGEDLVVPVPTSIGLRLVWWVRQKGGDPSSLHPTHPRKRREDGWGTQAYMPPLPAKARAEMGHPDFMGGLGSPTSGTRVVRKAEGGRFERCTSHPSSQRTRGWMGHPGFRGGLGDLTLGQTEG